MSNRYSNIITFIEEYKANCVKEALCTNENCEHVESCQCCEYDQGGITACNVILNKITKLEDNV